MRMRGNILMKWFRSKLAGTTSGLSRMYGSISMGSDDNWLAGLSDHSASKPEDDVKVARGESPCGASASLSRSAAMVAARCCMGHDDSNGGEARKMLALHPGRSGETSPGASWAGRGVELPSWANAGKLEIAGSTLASKASPPSSARTVVAGVHAEAGSESDNDDAVGDGDAGAVAVDSRSESE